MEKVPMCRICLAENVRMYVVVNRNLHELYEKLTNIPFVTEDSRPILACFFCSTKLKQCYQLLRQCLEAEELFAQRMKQGYEPNPKVTQDHVKFCNGLIKSPIVHLSLDDKCQTKSIAIIEELPAVCEGLDDVIEPKEKLQSDELEPGNLDEICLDGADIPPRHSEPDLEHNDPCLIEFKVEVKVEVEEEDLPKELGRGSDTQNLEPGNLDEICLDGADTPPRHSEPDLEDDDSLMEFQVEVVEDEVPKKKRRGSDTQRTPDAKLEDAITAEQTNKGNSQGTYRKERYKYDKRNINQVENIKHHTRTQIGEKHKCDVCKRSFITKSNLTKHISVFHSEEKPHKCFVCLQSFVTWSRLMLHTCTNTDENPFKCDVCQRSFRAERHLLSHFRVHTVAGKSHKCDICQRSFSGKAPLISHIRIHTGDKPHKCDVCQRSFCYKGLLSNHIRIHTADKPYKCGVCQSSFSQRDEFTKHTCIHTDENPY